MENVLQILNLLRCLIKNDYTTDDGIEATDYAILRSFDLLMELYNILEEDFPVGFPSFDSRGGVTLVWANTFLDKEIRLEIPSSSEYKTTINWFKGDSDWLVEEPTPDFVASKLRWLSHYEE